MFKNKIKNHIHCVQGASTSENGRPSKCSVWTTCRGRTLVRLSEHRLYFLLSEAQHIISRLWNLDALDWFLAILWIYMFLAHIRSVPQVWFHKYNLCFTFMSRYLVMALYYKCSNWLMWLIIAYSLKSFKLQACFLNHASAGNPVSFQWYQSHGCLTC